MAVEECVLQSGADSSEWSAKDWNERACNGIAADGTRIVLRGNRMKNVNFGITVSASHSLVAGNLIENFSGDGMRGLGDHSIFEDNVIIIDHNLKITDPAEHFADPGGRDLRLKPGSPAIDAGSSDLAPKTDRSGARRPQGRGVDIGAFESG